MCTCIILHGSIKLPFERGNTSCQICDVGLIRAVNRRKRRIERSSSVDSDGDGTLRESHDFGNLSVAEVPSVTHPTNHVVTCVPRGLFGVVRKLTAERLIDTFGEVPLSVGGLAHNTRCRESVQPAKSMHVANASLLGEFASCSGRDLLNGTDEAEVSRCGVNVDRLKIGLDLIGLDPPAVVMVMAVGAQDDYILRIVGSAHIWRPPVVEVQCCVSPDLGSSCRTELTTVVGSLEDLFPGLLWDLSPGTHEALTQSFSYSLS